MDSKLIKLALAGAITAVVIDYMFKPGLNRTLGL